MEAGGRWYISYPSKSDWIRIWPLGDLHLGNRGVEKDRLRKDIEEIRKDPYSFWIGLGDYADYISPGDRRFDAEILDDEELELRDIGRVGSALTKCVARWLQPIQHKCLGLCLGNHELSYSQTREQSDLHAVLCDNLHVRNWRYSAMFVLAFVRRTGGRPPSIQAQAWSKNDAHDTLLFKGFAHHGAGAAATKGGKAQRLEKFENMSTAQIIMTGHLHTALIDPCPIFDTLDDGSRIIERKRMGIMGGTYLRAYMTGMTGYGEQRGYPASTLGANWVAVRPWTGDFKSEVMA